MSKKIKRSKISQPIPDPQLEEVDEDRALEIELDEETKEIIIVHHYRRKWGDELEGDVEHIMTIKETNEFVVALLKAVDALNSLIMGEKNSLLVHKSTPTVIEGNPIKENKNVEGG